MGLGVKTRVLSGSLGLNYTPSFFCTAELKWTPRFWDQYRCADACRDSVSKNTASGGVAVYVAFISLSVIFGTAVLCYIGCCAMSEMVLTSFCDKLRNCDSISTHEYKCHCTQMHIYPHTDTKPSLTGEIMTSGFRLRVG